LEDGTVKGIIKISALAALSAATILATTSTLAAISLPSGWYVEGNIGQSKQTSKNYGAGTSTDNSGWAGSVIAGYKFMPYFGGEVGYTRYADTTIKTTGGSKVAKDRLYSVDIAGKAMLPITDSGFELFAKLGVARAYSKERVTDSTTAANNGLSFDTSQKSATALYMGLGADYSFMPNLAVNAQWARAKGNTNTGYLDLYSIGLTWLVG
jgi:hypothetical protein